jgi:hypothetical protein
MSDDQFWVWRRRGPYNDGEWRLQTDEAALSRVAEHPEQFEVAELVPIDAYNARQA